MTWVRRLFMGWTSLVLVFFYAPIAFLIVFSFNSSKLNVVWEGFSLRWYRELWSDSRLVAGLQSSLIVAAWPPWWRWSSAPAPHGSCIAIAIAACARSAPQRICPMVVPEIIMGVSLLVFFRSLDVKLGYTTIVIAHATFCFPFVMAAVQARLAGLDPSLEEAALDLGATPLEAFWHVIIPYLMPAIVSER